MTGGATWSTPSTPLPSEHCVQVWIKTTRDLRRNSVFLENVSGSSVDIKVTGGATWSTPSIRSNCIWILIKSFKNYLREIVFRAVSLNYLKRQWNLTSCRTWSTPYIHPYLVNIVYKFELNLPVLKILAVFMICEQTDRQTLSTKHRIMKLTFLEAMNIGWI